MMGALGLKPNRWDTAMKKYLEFRSTCLVALLLTGAGGAFAAEPYTANTLRLGDGEARPAASLDDAAFLVGSWTGTGFGQRFEETWNPPSAGSMVGMFKLYDGDEVAFYELMTLSVQDGSLSLRVRHFNADFSAWEEKAEFVGFRLVKLAENELHFGGLSFYKRDDNRIDSYLAMRSGDELSEQHVVYERRKADEDPAAN